MKIGPFNVRDVNRIKELFMENKIEFTVIVEKDAEEQIMSDFHRNFKRSSIGTLDLKTVYFEIEESDIKKVPWRIAVNSGVAVSSNPISLLWNHRNGFPVDVRCLQ